MTELPKPLIQLGPSQPAPSTGGPAIAKQIALQGRVLLERTGFVAQSFDEHDSEVNEFFRDILTELSIHCFTGERAEARSISEKVKALIAKCELFFCILPRRERITYRCAQNPNIDANESALESGIFWMAFTGEN